MKNFFDEYKFAIYGVYLLINAMSIVYMIKHPSVFLIKLALLVGIIDALLGLTLFIYSGYNFTKSMFLDK